MEGIQSIGLHKFGKDSSFEGFPTRQYRSWPWVHRWSNGAHEQGQHVQTATIR